MKTYQGAVGPLADSIIETVQASNGFVLEIGIGTGEGSTAMIQEGLENHPDPLHISVDWVDLANRPDIERPTVPWWHFVQGDSRNWGTIDAVQHITRRLPGVIFIDTDHNYEQMRAELYIWGGYANNKTVWLAHDTWMYGPRNDEMVRAMLEFAEASGWVYDDYRTDSHGLGRMRR